MKTHDLFRVVPFALVAGAAAVTQARAADADPAVFVRTAVDEVLAIAYDNASTTPLAERVRPALQKYFSFESITRRAVGPAWRQFSAEEKSRLTSLFTEVVIRSYANRFEAGKRPGITYGKPVVLDAARPNVRELPTTIDYDGKKYAVTYRLEQADGKWLISDVNIEGVSMIANWRSQLDPIAQKGGAAAVVAALEKNLSQELAK